MSADTVELVVGPSIERKLRKAWRRQRRFHNTRGLCHFLLWLGALLVADLVVDWLFLLPGYGRVLLVVINVATLAVVLYRGWWRHLRRYDPVRTALQVERGHPDLKSLLVSYVQFGRPSAYTEHMSAQLIEASRRLAVAATAPIDFREIVHWRDILRVGVFSACVVALCGGLSLNWPEFFSTLLYRLLNPGASIAYPTRTRIEHVTGSVTVPQGASVTVEARTSGLVPQSGTLWLRPEEGEWERVVMPPSGPGGFAYRFEQVLRGFEYRVRVGDAASETYQVRTVPPPHVLRTRALLKYPAYTGLPDKEVETLHLEVPEGTQVDMELECDRPLASAAVVGEGGQATPMRLDPAGRVASIGWTVAQSFPFHFRWTEKEHGFQYEGDVTYFIRAVADAPPEVEILAPAEDDKATVAKRLALRFQAADDYAVASAAVVYSVNEQPEQRRPLGAFGRATLDEQALWVLKESIPDLKETDTVTFAVEVADNRAGEGGANVTRSRPLRLEIVSVVGYLRHMAEKRARLFKEIEGMHEEETTASKEVNEMQEMPLPVPAAVP